MDNQSLVPNGYPISDAGLVSALDQFMQYSINPLLTAPSVRLFSQPVEARVEKEVRVTPQIKKTEPVKEVRKIQESIKTKVTSKVVVEPKRIKVEKAVEKVKEEIKVSEPVKEIKVVEKQELKEQEPKKEAVIAKEAETSEPLPVEKLVPKENYRESPEFYEIANYFHVQPVEFEEAKHKLSLIYDWAAFQAQSSKPRDILNKVRELEHNIPAPAIGERRYLNTFRFVKLSQK